MKLARYESTDKFVLLQTSPDELLDGCIGAVDSSSDKDSDEDLPLMQMAGRQQERLEFHAATLEQLADLEQTDLLRGMDAQLLQPAAAVAIGGICIRMGEHRAHPPRGVLL